MSFDRIEIERLRINLTHPKVVGGDTGISVGSSVGLSERAGVLSEGCAGSEPSEGRQSEVDAHRVWFNNCL